MLVNERVRNIACFAKCALVFAEKACCELRNLPTHPPTHPKKDMFPLIDTETVVSIFGWLISRTYNIPKTNGFCDMFDGNAPEVP